MPDYSDFTSFSTTVLFVSVPWSTAGSYITVIMSLWTVLHSSLVFHDFIKIQLFYDLRYIMWWSNIWIHCEAVTIKLITIFFMISAVLRGTGQIFYWMSFSFGLPDAFLLIRWRLGIWGKNSSKVRCLLIASSQGGSLYYQQEESLWMLILILWLGCVCRLCHCDGIIFPISHSILWKHITKCSPRWGREEQKQPSTF